MSAPTYRVITLPEPLFAFQVELFERAIREGLFVPDELKVASALWDRIRAAQVVEVPTEAPAPADTKGAEDGRAD